jgi:hypothetical protein
MTTTLCPMPSVQLLGDPLRPICVVLHSHHPKTGPRIVLAEQTDQQDRADPAAELDHTAPPIEDDVVADRHQTGRPHDRGAPRQVRP